MSPAVEFERDFIQKNADGITIKQVDNDQICINDKPLLTRHPLLTLQNHSFGNRNQNARIPKGLRKITIFQKATGLKRADLKELVYSLFTVQPVLFRKTLFLTS